MPLHSDAETATVRSDWPAVSLPYVCDKDPIRVRGGDRAVVRRDGVLRCCGSECRGVVRFRPLEYHIVCRPLNNRQVRAWRHRHVYVVVRILPEDGLFYGLLLGQN